jgi:hypothetical protein
MPGCDVGEIAKREWLDWLAERTEGDGIAGYDAVGWPAATWVLHAMYEDLGVTSEATHDEVRHARLAAGLERPLIVGSVNLDEESTVIGGSLGMSEPPGAGWARLRWHDLATRLAVDFVDKDVPPCSRWFPYRSWPARIEPPDEESLDVASLRVLVDRLAMGSVDRDLTRCVAYYSPLANGASFDETWMREIELGDIPSCVDRSAGRIGTPSNWWPLDRSWMVYTDWDLWATKVSGPTDLIALVESDPDL